ncbi:hypothetical protein B7486_58370 [cyanobacterium TDX16]|nr:hypothetical protein B7486_58370 [cyanobacterium TDX16]
MRAAPAPPPGSGPTRGGTARRWCRARAGGHRGRARAARPSTATGAGRPRPRDLAALRGAGPRPRLPLVWWPGSGTGPRRRRASDPRADPGRPRRAGSARRRLGTP